MSQLRHSELNPIPVYAEVSLIIVNAAYYQKSVGKIAALSSLASQLPC